MAPIEQLPPIDYLVIGHITLDKTPKGDLIGGTATYASLMAKAMGFRVGIVTSWGEEIPFPEMPGLYTHNYSSEVSTTFQNIYSTKGRIQTLLTRANALDFQQIPENWRQAPIVHIGPVAQEVEPSVIRHFQNSLVGTTPQGWLRDWDRLGNVKSCDWPEAVFVLQQADIAIISVEDVNGNENYIDEMSSACRILAVTEGEQGARVYWNGDVRRFHPPVYHEIDPTGAGDIFAAAFFCRFYDTRDAWEAGRFATQLSSISITREGLESIPTPTEIQDCTIEVF